MGRVILYRAQWGSGTLQILVREVLGSNLGRNTGYSEIRVFLQALQSNNRITSLKGHDRVLPNLFYFIIHLSTMLCSLATEKRLSNDLRRTKGVFLRMP
jgi:hypothetical protein